MPTFSLTSSWRGQQAKQHAQGDDDPEYDENELAPAHETPHKKPQLLGNCNTSRLDAVGLLALLPLWPHCALKVGLGPVSRPARMSEQRDR